MVQAEHSKWMVKLCESVPTYFLSNCIYKIVDLESVRQFQKQPEDGSDPPFVQFQTLSANRFEKLLHH